MSLGSKAESLSWMHCRNIGPPFSVAMPMVALYLWALSLASADWVRIPLGKKRFFPRSDSISKTCGLCWASRSFSSCANGFIEFLLEFLKTVAYLYQQCGRVAKKQ